MRPRRAEIVLLVIVVTLWLLAALCFTTEPALPPCPRHEVVHVRCH